uniref:putative insulin-like growth factor 2 antisense gene protein isoform X2 n=1 Tax=Callithrix jacchus TaxID=9483 RepID=UPI0023DCF923|nr:putative insulin-like growth factor 2 antisense gene protein isoform X2 [Callithrix jacchus]
MRRHVHTGAAALPGGGGPGAPWIQEWIPEQSLRGWRKRVWRGPRGSESWHAAAHPPLPCAAGGAGAGNARRRRIPARWDKPAPARRPDRARRPLGGVAGLGGGTLTPPHRLPGRAARLDGGGAGRGAAEGAFVCRVPERVAAGPAPAALQRPPPARRIPGEAARGFCGPSPAWAAPPQAGEAEDPFGKPLRRLCGPHQGRPTEDLGPSDLHLLQSCRQSSPCFQLSVP